MSKLITTCKILQPSSYNDVKGLAIELGVSKKVVSAILKNEPITSIGKMFLVSDVKKVLVDLYSTSEFIKDNNGYNGYYFEKYELMSNIYWIKNKVVATKSTRHYDIESGYVYMMKFRLKDGYEFYKIGFTTNDPEKRLAKILLSFIYEFGYSPMAKVTRKVMVAYPNRVELAIFKKVREAGLKEHFLMKSKIDGRTEFTKLDSDVVDIFKSVSSMNRICLE